LRLPLGRRLIDGFCLSLGLLGRLLLALRLFGRRLLAPLGLGGSSDDGRQQKAAGYESGGTGREAHGWLLSPGGLQH
jgi:hypothetical protein